MSGNIFDDISALPTFNNIAILMPLLNGDVDLSVDLCQSGHVKHALEIMELSIAVCSYILTYFKNGLLRNFPAEQVKIKHQIADICWHFHVLGRRWAAHVANPRSMILRHLQVHSEMCIKYSGLSQIDMERLPLSNIIMLQDDMLDTLHPLLLIKTIIHLLDDCLPSSELQYETDPEIERILDNCTSLVNNLAQDLKGILMLTPNYNPSLRIDIGSVVFRVDIVE